MSPQFKRVSLWLVTLTVGLLSGKIIRTSSTGGRTEPPLEFSASANALPKTFSPISTSARYLWSETAGLRDSEEYPSEVRRMHREAGSPLRATSLLSFNIQNSTFEQWEPLIAAGKIDRLEVLGELGAYLARTDTERALDLFFEGPYLFDNLSQVYAFRDPLVRTAADVNPEMVLEKLKGMRRGGVQMDASLFFSRHWAEKDPRATAEHFTDLVKLRNMRMDASPDMPDEVFANMIMKSWMEKAPGEAEEYVAALPDGTTKKALTAALPRQTQ